MKIVIRTVFFHFLCISVFAIFYYNFKHQFQDKFQDKFKNKDFTVFDCILLSTTIQSGVGITDIYPISNYAKLLMITQQLIMIMTHVFTLYIFNL
jgi:hypothetical protein